MYLCELRLSDVRQFDNRTFCFGPGINLLVGENGAGKTSLLRSIFAVLGPKGERNTPPTLTDEDIRLRSMELSIEAKVVSPDGATSNVSYSRTWGSRAQRSADRPNLLVVLYGSNEALCSSFVARRRRGQVRTKPPGDAPSESWLYEAIDDRGVFRNDRGQFGNSRVIKEFVLNALQHISPKFQSFDWVFEPYRCAIRSKRPGPGKSDSRSRNLLANAILRSLSEREEPLVTADESKITINSNGRIEGGKKSDKPVLPHFSKLLSQFRIVAELPDADSLVADIHLTPRIRIRTATDQFLLSQLSDGEKRLFSLFVDVARQLFVFGDGWDIHGIPAIILIDEIDVHLHPKWQRQIVPSLEDLFPACQFIATTHSPFVVQGVAESKVQHLNGTILGEFTDRGIEEITAKVMDIADHQVSPRYLEMLKVARQYFQILASARANSDKNEASLQQLKARLAELTQPFARNPAYQAYLELHADLELETEEPQ